MYQRTMTGPKPAFAEGEAPRDLSIREKVVVVPIIAAFILLGFFPKPVLDILNPAVDRTLTYVGVTDPRPTDASGSTK
jgi:NADH-quinone oxidoreductase subunit M